jgi:hypothetical protein
LFRDSREQEVFQDLLRICTGLEERLPKCTEEEIQDIADLVGLFASSARILTPYSRSKRASTQPEPMIRRG